MDHFALVYRLLFTMDGEEVTPGHMWGTADAIATIGNCRPLYTTERQVHREMLDAAGFMYDHLGDANALPLAKAA